MLDNFEQLPDAAVTALDRWSTAAPSVRFLVTSRRPTAIAGETSTLVTALDPASAAELLLGKTPRPSEAVLDLLLTRLGGNPLDLDLASSSLETMSPEQLLHRFEELSATPTRSLAWEALTPHEQDVIGQASVFCASASAGSGVEGLTVTLLNADGTDLSTPVSGTETPTMAAQIDEAALPGAGTYLIRLTKSGQSATVTGDWVRCGVAIGAAG